MKQETTDDMRRYLFNECLNLDPLPLEVDSSWTSVECKSVGLLDIGFYILTPKYRLSFTH